MLARGQSCLYDEKRNFPDSTAVAKALKPSYPVYCVRPELLEAQARRFISLFPGTALYAVKCNPHPMVMDALYRGGFRLHPRWFPALYRPPWVTGVALPREIRFKARSLR